MKEISYQDGLRKWSRPQRLALVVSNNKENQPNILSVAWNMRTSDNPPLIAISVGIERYSYNIIKESREFVCAIPGEDLSHAVLICGLKSGSTINKFSEANLTPSPAKYINVPLIKECFINLECRVISELVTGDHCLFVGEVLTTWFSEEEKSPLLLIGNESGYKVISEDFSYRFGIIKK